MIACILTGNLFAVLQRSVLQKRSYRLISFTSLLALRRIHSTTLCFCNLEISHHPRRPFFLSFLALYLGLFLRFLTCITCVSPHGQAGRSHYWRCEVDISYFISFSHCLETAIERALRWKGRLRHCWHIAGLYETWCLEGWAGVWTGTWSTLLFL